MILFKNTSFMQSLNHFWLALTKRQTFIVAKPITNGSPSYPAHLTTAILDRISVKSSQSHH